MPMITSFYVHNVKDNTRWIGYHFSCIRGFFGFVAREANRLKALVIVDQWTSQANRQKMVKSVGNACGDCRGDVSEVLRIL